MICEIPVKVSFLKHTITTKNYGVVEGDYNSTKLVFEFEEDVAGKRIEFVMSNPDGELIFMGDLKDNEVVLTGYTDEGKLCSLFNTSGPHAFELVYHGDNSQLTSATGWLHVSNRQVDAVETGSASLYALGKQAEYDRFWDAYQQNGTRKNYNSGFRSPFWTDDIYQPKYDIVATNGGAACFATSSITDTKVPITTNSMNQMFQQNRQIKIVRMIKFYNFDGNYTNAFQYCEELETLIFGGVIEHNGLNLQWSKKLSIESLRNIIYWLKDYSEDTSGTVWKVTVGSENLAKLTENDLNEIESKGWYFD